MSEFWIPRVGGAACKYLERRIWFSRAVVLTVVVMVVSGLIFSTIHSNGGMIFSVLVLGGIALAFLVMAIRSLGKAEREGTTSVPVRDDPHGGDAVRAGVRASVIDCLPVQVFTGSRHGNRRSLSGR